MGHQLVLVVVSNPHENVISQVESLMDRHSAYAKVEPYKQYFEPCDWDGRHWEEEDAEEFAQQRAQEFGEAYDRDQNGVYQWIDTNPNAQCDWFTIGGRWDGIFSELCKIENAESDVIGGRLKGNICPIEDLPDEFFPGSFVTPDGEWNFFGWRLSGEQPDQAGIGVIHRIIKEHKGKYVVAVDAHA